MIRTHEFKVNDATVTVREPKGVDRIDERIVYGKLTYDRSSERDRTRVVTFAEYVARTVSIDGEMGYPWASIDSPAADMQKAFDGWIEWPVAVMDAWAAAISAAATPPGELATQPDVDPNV